MTTKYDHIIKKLKRKNDNDCLEAAFALENLIQEGETIIKVFHKFGKACDDLVKEVEEGLNFK